MLLLSDSAPLIISLMSADANMQKWRTGFTDSSLCEAECWTRDRRRRCHVICVYPALYKWGTKSVLSSQAQRLLRESFVFISRVAGSHLFPTPPPLKKRNLLLLAAVIRQVCWYRPSGAGFKWLCPHERIISPSCHSPSALQEEYFTIMDSCALSTTWPSPDWRAHFVFFIANYKCPTAGLKQRE